jgi:hypothetical protein
VGFNNSARSPLPAPPLSAGILSAVAKPFIARISDITSRPTAYLLSLTFYVFGYIVRRLDIIFI